MILLVDCHSSSGVKFLPTTSFNLLFMMLMNICIFPLLLISLFVKGALAQTYVIQNINTGYYLTAQPTVPANCFANNVPLGFPSVDGSIRNYTQNDCVNNLNGIHYSDGQCLKIGISGSWSWDCRKLNLYYFSLVMSPTCNVTQMCFWDITAQNQILLRGTSWALTYLVNAAPIQNLNVMDLGANATKVQQFRYDSSSKTIVNYADGHVVDILHGNRSANAIVGVYKYNSGWNQQFNISSAPDVIIQNENNYLGYNIRGSSYLFLSNPGSSVPVDKSSAPDVISQNTYLNKTITGLGYSFLSNRGSSVQPVDLASDWESFDVVMNNQGIGYLKANAGPNGAKYCAPDANALLVCDQSNITFALQFNVSADGNTFTMKAIGNGNANNYCRFVGWNSESSLFCDADISSLTTFVFDYHNDVEYLSTTIFTSQLDSFLSNQCGSGLDGATTVDMAGDWESFDVVMNDQGYGYLKANSGPTGAKYCAVNTGLNVNYRYLICDQTERILQFRFNVSADGSTFTMKTIGNGNMSNNCAIQNQNGKNLLFCDTSVGSLTTFTLNYQLARALSSVSISAAVGNSNPFLSNQGSTGVTTVAAAASWEMFDIGMNDQGFGYLKSRNGPSKVPQYCALNPRNNVMCDQPNKVIAFLFIFSTFQSFIMKSVQNGIATNNCTIRNSLLICDSTVTAPVEMTSSNTFSNVSIAYDFLYLSNQGGSGLTSTAVASDWEMFDIGTNAQGFGYLKARAGPSGPQYCALSRTSNYTICDHSNIVVAFQFMFTADGSGFLMKSVQTGGYCYFTIQHVYCDADVSAASTFTFKKTNFNVTLSYSNIIIGSDNFRLCSNSGDLGVTCYTASAGASEKFDIGMDPYGVGYLRAISGNSVSYCTIGQNTSLVTCNQANMVNAFKFNLTGDGRFTMREIVSGDYSNSYCAIRYNYSPSDLNNVTLYKDYTAQLVCDADEQGPTYFYLNATRVFIESSTYYLKLQSDEGAQNHYCVNRQGSVTVDCAIGSTYPSDFTVVVDADNFGYLSVNGNYCYTAPYWYAQGLISPTLICDRNTPANVFNAKYNSTDMSLRLIDIRTGYSCTPEPRGTFLPGTTSSFAFPNEYCDIDPFFNFIATPF